MRYWTYINTEILGPFEKEQLALLANFTASSLICPETPAGGDANDWKEASTYPEVAAALASPGQAPAPEPAKTRPLEMESPLAMTMRGTLIEPGAETPTPAAAQPPTPAAAQPQPAAATPVPPPATPVRPAESPLAMTMRGTLIEPVTESPASDAAQPPAAKAPAAFSLTPIKVLKPSSAEPPKETPKPVVPENIQAEPENIPAQREPYQPGQNPARTSATLISIGENQVQILGRLDRLDAAIAEIKALLTRDPAKK